MKAETLRVLLIPTLATVICAAATGQAPSYDLTGNAGQGVSTVVESAGDVNNDGIVDIAVAAVNERDPRSASARNGAVRIASGSTIAGRWYDPCAPVSCSTSCSPDAAWELPPSRVWVRWGTTNNDDATIPSTFAWEGIVFEHLPEDGEMVPIGRLAFINGQTDIGTEISSVQLRLISLNPILQPTIPVLEFCIATTRNDHADHARNADSVFIPALGYTLSVNEGMLHGEFLIMAVAHHVITRVGGRDLRRVELTPVSVIADSPNARAEMTPEVQLDYSPGECPNTLFVRDDPASIFENLEISPNLPPRYVLTFPGQYSAQDVDLDSLSLIFPGLGELTPSRVEIADITSPIFEESVCMCSKRGRAPDGKLDIYLSYYDYLVEFRMNSIDPLDGDTVQIGVRGFMNDGTIFQASDCVQIRRAP